LYNSLILLNILKILGSVAGAVLALVWLSAAPAWARDGAPGQRFDVGGYRLNIACQGRGRPAVIMDAGLGGSSGDWRYVQRDLHGRTTACVYDRAGYGYSDVGPAPRTSARIVAELHALLRAAELPPPWVLVGHSFGGYNMRLFAARYPQEVAGLVLVDAPHEGQIDRFLDSELLQGFDPQGVLRQLWESDLLSGMLKQLAPLAQSAGINDKTSAAVMNELAAYRQSGESLRKADLPPDLPITVIMHGRPLVPGSSVTAELERDWLELQRDLAARYPHSRFIIARKSDHNVEYQQPELISNAVLEMLTKDRTRPIPSPTDRADTDWR
jgi:pimeloyl-ACP methyl ester carboxylesterase